MTVEIAKSANKRVSLRQLAKELRLSTGTISDILNPERVDRYNAETVKRVNEAVERLQYVPSKAARLMRQKRSRTLGFLLTRDFRNPYFARLAHAAQVVARRLGYMLETVIVDDADTGSEAECVRRLEEQRVEGVIIGPLYEPLDVERHAVLVGIHCPVVTLGGSGDRRWDDVRLDAAEGWRSLLRHAHGLGHRRVVLFGLPLSQAPHVSALSQSLPALARDEGFAEATEPLLLTDSGDYARAYATALAYLDAWTARPVGERPTVAVCLNDLTAMTLMAACHARGVRIPGDLSVTGCDNLPESGYWYPPLTTLDNFVERQMDMAIHRLLERIERPDDPRVMLLIEPALVARASTGAPPING